MCPLLDERFHEPLTTTTLRKYHIGKETDTAERGEEVPRLTETGLFPIVGK